MQPKKIKTINREVFKSVAEIIDYLCTLNGFDDWWYNLDDETENEIETKLRKIISKRFVNGK